MASLALQRISDHEDRCGERWEAQRVATQALTQALKEGFERANATRRELHTRINALILLALATSLGALGWLATRVIG